MGSFLGYSFDYLSTHPLDENRIARITEKLPEALKYYQPQGKK